MPTGQDRDRDRGVYSTVHAQQNRVREARRRERNRHNHKHNHKHNNNKTRTRHDSAGQDTAPPSALRAACLGCQAQATMWQAAPHAQASHGAPYIARRRQGKLLLTIQS